MKKYRKKPIVIEAMKWDGENHRGMFDFLTSTKDQNITTYGENFSIEHDKTGILLYIKTLEGKMLASIGDYIIKGIHGEFYPCKPDIFEKTYEEVE